MTLETMSTTLHGMHPSVALLILAPLVAWHRNCRLVEAMRIAELLLSDLRLEDTPYSLLSRIEDYG